jgi:hypothetical protein
MGRYDKQLKALAEAETPAFGPIRFAALTLPATRAYQELAEAADPALRADLERLVAKGPPAAKVYAAVLLSRLPHPWRCDPALMMFRCETGSRARSNLDSVIHGFTRGRSS